MLLFSILVFNLLIQSKATSSSNEENELWFGSKTVYNKVFEKIKKDFKNGQHFLPKQCKPKMIYFICRHSIRYPSKEKIINLKENIYFLRDNLVNQQYKNNFSDIDEETVNELKNWKLRYDTDDGYHITESGFNETRILASRFVNEYPNFFNLSKTNLNMYISHKFRTNETAYEFFKYLYQNQTFNFTIKKELSFHQTCKNILKNNGVLLSFPKIIDNFTNSNLFINLRKNLGRKFGLDIDFKTLKLLYMNCFTEFSIYNEKTWCKLFNKQDLVLLEYLHDLISYLHGGYGRDINKNMSCSHIVDLVKTIEKSKKIIDSKELSEKPLITSINFSHSGNLKRIFTFYGLFKNFFSTFHLYSKNDYFNEWRSSFNLPFLANLRFVLYDCSINNNKDLRLTAEVQEHLVQLDGCNEKLCKLEEFLKYYDDSIKNCNLNKICKI